MFAWAGRPILRRCAFAAISLGMAFEVVRAATGVGGSNLDSLTDTWVYQGIEFVALAVCLARVLHRREQRLAWALMTASLAFWTVGDLIWSVWLDPLANPPFPSVADLAYLLMYPAMYAALMAMIRSRARRTAAAQWLDGGVVALAIGAVAAALVFSQVMKTAASGRFAAEAVNIAYPVLDFILLMFVVMAYGLSRWRPSREWLAVGGGVALLAIADIVYADQSAGGMYLSSGLVNVLYLASFSVLAVAAWLPARQRSTSGAGSHDTIVLSFGAAALALAMLVAAAFTYVTPLAVGLAASCLVLAAARSAITYRENVRMLRATSRQAVTDALTGLGNRRQMLDDLEDLFRGDRQATLAFFDLNGFKRYNDAYGHAVGDALLVRLSAALRDAVGADGSAYRLGGDEFCLLLDGHHRPEDPLLVRTRSALSESGGGFEVTTSMGLALLPQEAARPEAALRLADERMYADKGRTQRSMVRDVLMQLISERTPGLSEHASGVTAMASALATQFGLGAEDLDETLRAAELHDIGKLAIPDAILDKPGPLNADEWGFMRQHPVIGQRILAAAAALRPVGAIVRASHERWDGGGYPDGLSGEDIPLGARIIAVCEAYDAMLSERCYRPARSHEEALAELRNHSGSQFDPAVVEALQRHFRDQPAPRPGGPRATWLDAA